MCSSVVKYVLMLGLIKNCLSKDVKPQVEEKPVLLHSYIPATMQIIAYLTDMMKYDLKPPSTPAYGSTTVSTIRPTPFHRPAIYAPLKPPGPETFFQSAQKSADYKEYVERLKSPSGLNYFERYKYASDRDNNEFRNTDSDNEDILEGVATYFGKNFINILKLVKDVEKDVSNNIDEQSQEFLKKYDDSNFRVELLRQKQVPPTKAYVTLLSLYDALNKESKRLGLSKYNGYTEQILRELADTSSHTSAYQLRIVLKMVVDRRDTPRQDILKKMNQLIVDLDDANSYIQSALKYIPPLVFAI